MQSLCGLGRREVPSAPSQGRNPRREKQRKSAPSPQQTGARHTGCRPSTRLHRDRNFTHSSHHVTSANSRRWKRLRALQRLPTLWTCAAQNPELTQTPAAAKVPGQGTCVGHLSPVPGAGARWRRLAPVGEEPPCSAVMRWCRAEVAAQCEASSAQNGALERGDQRAKLREGSVHLLTVLGGAPCCLPPPSRQP